MCGAISGDVHPATTTHWQIALHLAQKFPSHTRTCMSTVSDLVWIRLLRARRYCFCSCSALAVLLVAEICLSQPLPTVLPAKRRSTHLSRARIETDI